jgi:hypothetical protein
MKNPKSEFRIPKVESACSADFQSAVSPTSSRQHGDHAGGFTTSGRLRIGNPRYSRLESCATCGPRTVSRFRRLAVSFLLALVLLAGGPAAADILFHDDFNGLLNPAWTILRPDASFYSLQATGLVLRCNRWELWQPYNTALNVFLIANPAPGDFTVTAKLRWLVPPTVNWGQFDLLAYDDDDNHVRLAHGCLEGALRLDNAGEAGGAYSSHGVTEANFGTGWFWLQMRKRGTAYSAYYSTDGVTFIPASGPFIYGDGTPAKLGFVAMVDPNQSATVLVDSFTVEAIPPLGTFTDDFNGALDPAWTILRPDAGFYSLQPTGLVVRCHGGDLYEAHTDWKNIFLIPNPTSGDFTMTAKVRWLVPPSANWAQFDLLAHDDENNHVRLHEGWLDGKRRIYNGSEAGGHYLVRGQADVNFGTSWYWLQMRKRGTSYSGWYSTNGVDFSQAGASFTYGDGTPANLGLTAMVDPTQTATVLIDSFTVEDTPVPASNYTLDWWTVDGGGSDTLSTGQFTLAGTVGQPDASTLQTVGRYSLSGGYWAMIAPNPGTYYPPLTLTNGLALWLAADFGVTNSSGRVSGWADQSGAGHHASQPNSANQPTLVANQLNGLPVVRFGSGGDRFLTLVGQVITSQQFTIIVVTRDHLTAVSYRELISNWDWAWAGNSVFFGHASQAPVVVRFTDDFASAGTVANPASFFMLTGVSGRNSVAVCQNTRVIASRGTPLIWRKLDGLPYVVGRQGTLNGEYWRGDIAELLVCNRELLAGELTQVWQYLGDKYFPGTFVWPVITSALTATGRVNRPFTYTITASGNPTAYGASGLPAGLSVNTASGLVSGTPETAGAFTVLLSATNATGVGTTNLLLSIADNAPSQWAGNGHWYQAVYAGPSGISWPDASAAATNAHGYLATITSADENAFAYALVTDPIFWFTDTFGNGAGPWLGGLQPSGSPEPSGNWQWVTGELMSSHYQNWAPGEPSNYLGTEDRINFFGAQTAQSPQWNDTAASALLRGYVIEYPQYPWRPILSITLSNTVAIISWPAPAEGWLLDRTNVLTGVAGPWTPVPPPYQTNGGVISVNFANTPPAGNQFFRLHKP